ncbi:MAG: phosphoglycerate kinase [Candidatus Neomarinimicrobiota bacterium]
MINNLNSLKLENEKVLIRADLNVPMKEGSVSDDFRIRKVLPTIHHCLENGASVILMSHLGRPKGRFNEELSLMPIGETLCDHLEMSIKFSKDCISSDALDVSLGLQSGEIHLLENLRFHSEEIGNESQFSRILSKHGTCYVNDAFGTAHRAHASNVGVTEFFNKVSPGFLMEAEYKFLYESMQVPQRPLTIILGGAKIKSKLPLIKRFLRDADHLIIGGGMVFTILKAGGYNIGQSICDLDLIKASKEILDLSNDDESKLILPSDFRVTKDLDSGNITAIRDLGSIKNDEIGIDIGPVSEENFSSIIARSHTIVWNGPMGIFETPEFSKGTLAVAEAVAKRKNDGGISIIGGGDSASAVKTFKLEDEMTHISTGGGASLELLAGNELPALKALRIT